MDHFQGTRGWLMALATLQFLTISQKFQPDLTKVKGVALIIATVATMEILVRPS